MRNIAMILTSLLVLSACGSSKKINQKTVWMSTDPIQCLGNAWEKHWTEAHPDERYPVGDPRKFEEPEQFIFRAFMLEQYDVSIMQIRYKPYPDDAMVCDACSCPVGYTLFIEVSPADAEKLADTPFQKTKKVPTDNGDAGN